MAKTQEIVDVLFQLKDGSSATAKKIVEELNAVNKSLDAVSKKRPTSQTGATLEKIGKSAKTATSALRELNNVIGTKGALANKLKTIGTAAESAAKGLRTLGSRSTFKAAPIVAEATKIVNSLKNIQAQAKLAAKDLASVKLTAAPTAAAKPREVVQAAKVGTTSPREVDATTAAIERQTIAAEKLTHTSEHYAKTSAATNEVERDRRSTYDRSLRTFNRITDTVNAYNQTLAESKLTLASSAKSQKDFDTAAKVTNSSIGVLRNRVTQLAEAEIALTRVGGEAGKTLAADIAKYRQGLEKTIKTQENYAATFERKSTQAASLEKETKVVSELSNGYKNLLSDYNNVTSANIRNTKAFRDSSRGYQQTTEYLKQGEGSLKSVDALLERVSASSQKLATTESASGQALYQNYQRLEGSLTRYRDNLVRSNEAITGRQTHLSQLAEEKRILDQVSSSYKNQSTVVQSLVKDIKSKSSTDAETLRNTESLKKSQAELAVQSKRARESLRLLSTIKLQAGQAAPLIAELNQLRRGAVLTRKSLHDNLKIATPVNVAKAQITDLEKKLQELQARLKAFNQRAFDARTGEIRTDFKTADFDKATAGLNTLRSEFTAFNADIKKTSNLINKENLGKELGGQLRQVQTNANLSSKSIGGFITTLNRVKTARGPFRDILADTQGLAVSMRAMTEQGASMGTAIGRSFQKLGASLRIPVGVVNDFAGAIDQLEKELVRFRSGVVTWSVGLLMLGTALSVPFVAAINIFRQLTDIMAQVRAVTNATAEEFEGLMEIATLMGRTTRFTAEQAAQGLLFLGRAGFTANEAIAVLPTTLRLAQAAAIDLGRAADIVTNIMTSFSATVEELPEIADALTLAVNSSNATLESLGYGFTYIGSIARGLGGDFNDLIGSLAKLNDAGFKGTLAGTSLRGALDGLFNPTKQEAEVMAQLSERMGILNLRLKDSQGNFVGFADLIRQLENASFTSEEALRLFGQRAGPGISALLRIGSEELSAYIETLENAGGTTQRIADQMSTTLQSKFLRTLSALQGLAENLGKNLEKPLILILDTITGLVNAFTELRENLGIVGQAIDLLVTGVVGLIAALGAATFTWFLMIVPLKQFAAGFKTLTGLWREGTKVLVGLKKAADDSSAAMAKQAFNIARGKTDIASNTAILNSNTAAIRANTSAKQESIIVDTRGAPIRRNAPVAASMPGSFETGFLQSKPAQQKLYKSLESVYKTAGERSVSAFGKGLSSKKSTLISILSSLGDVAGILAVRMSASFGNIIFAVQEAIAVFLTLRGAAFSFASVGTALKGVAGVLLSIVRFLTPLGTILTAVGLGAYFLRDAFKDTNEELHLASENVKKYGDTVKKAVNDVDALQKRIAKVVETTGESNPKVQQLQTDLKKAALQTITALKEAQSEAGLEFQFDVKTEFVEGELSKIILLTEDGEKTNLLYSKSALDIAKSVKEQRRAFKDLSKGLEEVRKNYSAEIALGRAKLQKEEIRLIKEKIEKLNKEKETIQEIIDFRKALNDPSDTGAEYQRINIGIEEEKISLSEKLSALNKSYVKNVVEGNQLMGLSDEERLKRITEIAQAEAQKFYDEGAGDDWIGNLSLTLARALGIAKSEQEVVTEKTKELTEELNNAIEAVERAEKSKDGLDMTDPILKSLSSLEKLNLEFEKMGETLDELKDKAKEKLDELFEIDNGRFESQLEDMEASLQTQIEAIQNEADIEKQASDEILRNYRANIGEIDAIGETSSSNKEALKDREVLIEQEANRKIFLATKHSTEERLKVLDAFYKEAVRRNPQLADEQGNLVGEAERTYLERKKEILDEEYNATQKHLENLLTSRKAHLDRLKDLEEQRRDFVFDINKAISDFESGVGQDSTTAGSFEERQDAAKKKSSKLQEQILEYNGRVAEAARNKDLKSLEKYKNEQIKLVDELTKLTQKQSGDPEALVDLSRFEQEDIVSALQSTKTEYEAVSDEMGDSTEDALQKTNTAIAETAKSLDMIRESLEKIAKSLTESFDKEAVFKRLQDQTGKLSKSVTKAAESYTKISKAQKKVYDSQENLDAVFEKQKEYRTIKSVQNQLTDLNEEFNAMDLSSIDLNTPDGKKKIEEYMKTLRDLGQDTPNIASALYSLGSVPKEVADEFDNLSRVLNQDWQKQYEKAIDEDAIAGGTENVDAFYERFKKAFSELDTGTVKLEGELEKVSVNVGKEIDQEAQKPETLDALESAKEAIDYTKQNLDLGTMQLDVSVAETALESLRSSLIATKEEALQTAAAVASVAGVTVVPTENYIQSEESGKFVQYEENRMGGYIQKFDRGGRVKGPGTGMSDSILSWLSNGEYVIDAFTTKFFGKNFFARLQKQAKSNKSKPVSMSKVLKKAPETLSQPTFSFGGIVGNFDRLVSNLAPQPQLLPAFASGGPVSTIPGGGVAKPGTNMRPVNLHINGSRYPMVADTKVVSNLTRELQLEAIKRGKK